MANLTNEAIEKFAVSEVEKILYKTGRVSPDIPTNDKAPSWDGNILFYKDTKKNSFAKEHLISKIPVQVKGREVENFRKKNITKSFDKSDLQNYYADGGVIIFLVEILLTEEDYKHKIYYASLLPLDLRQILDFMKDGQSQKSVKFKELKQGKNNTIMILEQFVKDKEKQPKYLVDKRFNIDDLESITLTPKDYLTNFIDAIGKEHYMYGSFKDTNFQVPVNKVTVNGIIGDFEEKISIKGEVFFNKLTRKFLENNLTRIEFGDKITLTLKNNDLKFNIKLGGNNIENSIKTLQFLLKLVEYKEFSINNHPISVKKLSEVDLNISEFQNDLKILKNIQSVYEYFNIKEYKNVLKLSSDNIRDIEFLYEHVINAKPTNLSITCEDICKISYSKIEEKNILLLAIKTEENKYNLFDFFKEAPKYLKGVLKYNDNEIFASVFILLEEEDILSINFNCDIVLDSIKSFEYNNYYSESITLFILKLIKIYDSYKINYLDLALELINYLYENEVNNIFFINKMQILKRKNIEFTSEDRFKLINIKLSDDSNLIKCSVCLLLDQFEEFKYLFNELSKEEKECLVNFPIYNLYKSK